MHLVRDLGPMDPFLDGVSADVKLLIAKAFIVRHRLFDFDQSGAVGKMRERPMVSTTVEAAIGHVAKTFRANNCQSPFHYKGDSLRQQDQRLAIRELIKAFSASDGPKKKQKSVTTELLCDMLELTKEMGEFHQHSADLIVGAYFFAMRACEYAKTKTPGQTKTLSLGNITFRDKRRRILSHDDPLLEEKAAYVTICFVNQKNGLKMDRRTQARSNHDELCPVRSWARVCKRVRRTTGHCDDNTLVCKIGIKGKGNVFATDESTLKLLRLTCRTYGSDGLYGIEPHELGTKSVRSGGAMALFMMGYSPEKIMILGRWGSTAFLDYIRPQTLEWTNMMSSDMARVPKMMDLNKSHLKRSKTNEEKQWSTFEFLPGFFRKRH